MSLGGCFGSGNRVNTPTKIEYQVVMPEQKYFDCKEIPLPTKEELKTWTDVQVSMLINDLVKENRLCVNNAKATQEFLLEAKKRLEKPD